MKSKSNNPTTSHPHFELFQKFGSPKNFLSLEFGSGKELEENETQHYSASQSSFANHSMASFIDLTRDFNWRDSKFKMEDLAHLISSEIAQNVFNIAAKNGDVNFFKMLKKECENSVDFQRQFDAAIAQINRDEIISYAGKYGGEILNLVSDLKPSNEPSATTSDKVRPAAQTTK